MGKRPLPPSPFWGKDVRMQPRYRMYFATCYGCLESIRRSLWEKHPIKCSNKCSYSKISAFQKQFQLQNTSQSKNTTNQKCVFEENNQIIENQNFVDNEFLSSRVKIQYESSSQQEEQWEPKLRQDLYVRQVIPEKFNQKDFQFELIPKKGSCYFSKPIEYNFLLKFPEVYKKRITNRKNKKKNIWKACSELPTFNFEKPMQVQEKFPQIQGEELVKTLKIPKAFVNDVISTTILQIEQVTTEPQKQKQQSQDSQLSSKLQTKTMKKTKIIQKDESKSEILKPKPRGHYCAVCGSDFQDYLRHINGMKHKKCWRQKNSIFDVQLFKTISVWDKRSKVPVEQKSEEQVFIDYSKVFQAPKNDKGGFNLVEPKQITDRQQNYLKLLKNYNNELKKISRKKTDKQKSKCKRNMERMKHQIRSKSLSMQNFVDLYSLIKKCCICDSRQLDLDEIDQQWLECVNCDGKFHIQCLKNKQCTVCFGIKQLKIQKPLDSCSMVGEQLLTDNNDDWNTNCKSNRKIAKQREEQVINLLKSRGVEYRKSIALQSLFVSSVNFVYDPFIQRAPFELQNLYMKHLNGEYFPPVYLRHINSKKGIGVFAEQQIPPLTFICEYAGDALPQTYAKMNPEYNMKLKYGPTPDESIIITVLKHSSLGPLINHNNKSKANCKSIRIYCCRMVRIFIFTSRKVCINEELTYNYNGGQNYYPTDFNQK